MSIGPRGFDVWSPGRQNCIFHLRKGVFSGGSGCPGRLPVAPRGPTCFLPRDRAAGPISEDSLTVCLLGVGSGQPGRELGGRRARRRVKSGSLHLAQGSRLPSAPFSPFATPASSDVWHRLVGPGTPPGPSCTPRDLHSRSLCHTLLGPNWKTIFAGLLYNIRALTVLFSENKAPQRHLLESKPVGGFSQNPGQGSRSAWCRGPQRRSRAGRAPSLQPRPGLGVRGPPGFLRGMDQSGGALCLLGSPTERWRLE